MKVLKILAIITVVIVVAFFSIGVIKPTVDYGASVQVSKSVEEAWSVYQDTSLLSEWVPAIKSIKQVSGGEEMVGSVYEIQMDHEGQMVTTVEEVTAFEPNKRMAMIFSNDVMVLDNEVVFTVNESGGTTITSTASARGTSMIWRSMFALMGDGFTKQETAHMNALAELIERTETEVAESDISIPSDSTATDTIQLETSEQ